MTDSVDGRHARVGQAGALDFMGAFMNAPVDADMEIGECRVDERPGEKFLFLRLRHPGVDELLVLDAAEARLMASILDGAEAKYGHTDVTAGFARLARELRLGAERLE